MARTPRLTKIPVDERKLADLVKTKSDLSIRGQRDAWKKIVEEHEAPVEDVKKAWSKHHEEDAKLKMDLNRRKSLRSNSVDLTNDQLKAMELRRRSLRSSSIDKSSLISNSTENSCASSICSISPKGEDKRCLRTRSQLASITEAKLMSMAAGDAGIMEMSGISKDSKIQDADDEEIHESDEDETLVLEMTHQEEDISEIVTDVVERIQQDIDEEIKNPSPRFFEAVQNLKKSPTTNISPKPKPIGVKNNNNNNKMKRNYIANDSTRAFFDSMSLTVASFPVHLQAQVKIQICKIVGEIEYDLNLSKAK
ncbi:uncharacterized protein LOC127284872 [Leptopilina boulardi]|uniref:uncharacterized protein LOC127284872 n=1 Tax=Leptopilina boulardi TaxID=63433 RepID=UPI0021F6503C|nr:uncharacterized protein LOC127284872 [Leptopilina boulardi]